MKRRGATNVTVIGLPNRTIERRRWEKFPDGGGTSHPDGTEEVTLVAEIDPVKLAFWVGDKAARSAKGVSRVCGGAVTVRVTSRNRHAEWTP